MTGKHKEAKITNTRGKQLPALLLSSWWDMKCNRSSANDKQTSKQATRLVVSSTGRITTQTCPMYHDEG